VIATGFEGELAHEESAPHSAVKPEPIKGLDRSSFLRKVSAGDRRDLRSLTEELHAEEAWDVPTFLRKQAD
jgi:hypothetical protein